MDNTLKAEELRIGNILQYTELKVFVIGVTPRSVDLGYFTDSVGFTRYFDNVNLKPIKLSPEWLERMGFKQVPDMDDWDWQAWEINEVFSIQKDKSNNEFKHVWDAAFTGAPIQYVHQLQNLYFALTGSELVLKQ